VAGSSSVGVCRGCVGVRVPVRARVLTVGLTWRGWGHERWMWAGAVAWGRGAGGAGGGAAPTPLVLFADKYKNFHSGESGFSGRSSALAPRVDCIGIHLRAHARTVRPHRRRPDDVPRTHPARASQTSRRARAETRRASYRYRTSCKVCVGATRAKAPTVYETR
jgi:hypothetical protein